MSAIEFSAPTPFKAVARVSNLVGPPVISRSACLPSKISKASWGANEARGPDVGIVDL
jgi:hypothetical protein